MYGEKIKTKRRELNLSQEDLADKLGVTRQAISKWENDKASPSMTNLSELSDVFGLEMAYFIGEDRGEIKNLGQEENNEDSPESKVWDLISLATISILGFIFFAAYYFLIMEEYFKKDPKAMPYLIMTIYLAAGIFAFPQAYKDLEEKIQDLDYLLFSKLVLPLVYIFSPLIALYYITKKKN